MQRAVSVEIQCPLRGANRPDSAGGDELQSRVFPCDDGERVEGYGPYILLHEP